MFALKNGRFGVLILLILAGVVVGGFIGEYLGQMLNMKWLMYGDEFGISEPFVLNLGIIKLQFGFVVRFSISGIIGILIAIFTYKKII